MAHFLYQGFVEPPFVDAPPPPAPEQWTPIYPDRCPAAPALLAAIMAGAVFFTPVLTPSENTGGAPGIGQVFAGPHVQYQSQVAPFAVAYAQQVPTIDGWGQPASVPVRLVFVTPSVIVEPPASVQPLGHIGWQGWYPDRIDRVVSRVDTSFLAEEPFPRPAEQNLISAVFPDVLSRPIFRPPSVLVEPPETGAIGWLGTYPDRIARVVLATAVHQASFTPTYLPIFDLRWQATYPEQIVRQIFGAALQQSFAFWPEPLPDEPAPLLSWHPLFPDFAPGARIAVSLIPFVDTRNLEPIPNEGGGQQLITLGVEIGVTDVPVLGGWVPF